MKRGINLNLKAEPQVNAYYNRLYDQVAEQYAWAEKAKATGRDATALVESKPAMDLADRCEQIIGPPGVAKRYRELFAERKDRLNCIFTIFEEILDKKLGDFETAEKRLEKAVKTSLVLVTEGVVVAPLDGVPSVKISKNYDGSPYVDIYFAGPIRAAGGTATVLPLILGDYARKLLGLDRYKPTDEEVERYVEECAVYDEIFTRQYKLSGEEVRKIIRGCPVCINGEPTEEREVSDYRNLERVHSNRVRGGMCLVLSEGIALKAMKILQMAKRLGLDWGWLEQIIKIGKGGEKEINVEPSYSYLTRIAAGRPIFAYPSRMGGFRLRYGRTRNSGIMGKGLHPATMVLSDEFISVGVQLKVERPGKSAGVFPCDSIEGPIVRLASGEVRQLHSLEEARQCLDQVKEVLFLGDLLVSYGDFKQAAHPLMPAGYCEEWWLLELQKQLAEGKKVEGIELGPVLKNPKDVDGATAVELSLQLGIPLHPKYVHYYKALNRDELLYLIEKAKAANKVFDETRIVGAELAFDEELKKLLERIGLPHKPVNGALVVGETQAYPFLKTVGALADEKPGDTHDVLECLSRLSGLTIRDKGGTFIGARMGRPETSRPRKMVGNPHVLFPIGLAGENIRSINKAMNSQDAKRQSTGVVEVDIAHYVCPGCRKTMPYYYCRDCKARTVLQTVCPKCGLNAPKEKCPKCSVPMKHYTKRKIDLNAVVEAAVHDLNTRFPELVKGVKGLINEAKVPEPLEKGILRALYDLHVFRDGTIRYELLNAPLTHFKPQEIGLSVEKARALGYDRDLHGRELTEGTQLLEIFPQDIVIHKEAGDFLVRDTKFIDDLLEKFFGVERKYKCSSREDLVGELVLGLAPHTSAAIVGRIIGYTEARLCFGHPYFHQVKRRNIDGDQDSIMLLMDGLLNFSEAYLSASRGGRMDAPLAFTVALDPNEIDDEVHNMEVCTAYPLELYEQSQKLVMPKLDSIETVKMRLGKPGQYSGIGFTHETSVFDAGPKVSKYIQLGSMEEKIKTQAKLQAMIRAVSLRDSLERVLVSHFLPDIVGNARAFSRQNFRCTKCNYKFRRVPLVGKCTKCGGNIILTIAQGSVRKYIDIAKQIIHQYDLSDYLRQRLKLIEKEVNSIFSNEKSEQKSLLEFA